MDRAAGNVFKAFSKVCAASFEQVSGHCRIMAALMKKRWLSKACRS
jgi:hypothetical protein